MSTYTFNLDGIDEVAKAIMQTLNWGDVVAVNGEMGYGKTTLIRRMIHAIDPMQAPASPTFAIMSVHPLVAPHCFIHIDAYRIKHAQELINLGIDQLDLTNAITFIEWCELIPRELLTPNHALNLHLGAQENERIIHYDAL